MINFDTLEYTKGAEAIGIKREHAEYTAKSMASVYKEINNETVTKSYLSKELNHLEEKLTNEFKLVDEKLSSLKNELTVKLGSIMIAGIGILGFILHK